MLEGHLFLRCREEVAVYDRETIYPIFTSELILNLFFQFSFASILSQQKA